MVLGLTGGIATGKSTVAEYFIKKKIPVICADKISKQIINNKEILDEIAKKFGNHMINNGELDRKKMREFVFKDKERVKILNSITHPPIINMLQEQIKIYKEYPLVIVDIPLLFEGKYEFLVEKILLISCEKNIQIERIMKRDSVTFKNAINIINNQMLVDEKKKKSDFIIENSETEIELYEKLDTFLKKIEISL